MYFSLPMQHKLSHKGQLRYSSQSIPHTQGFEAELGTTGSEWLYDARNVVTDETEAGGLGLLLHGAAESCLGISSH